MATDGFVVIAPEWQTFGGQAGDPDVEAIVRFSITAFKTRQDVDAQKLGSTGFCARGRFTMLFLPQFNDFRADVAFYGFPYSQSNTNNTTPADHIGELSAPILVIHPSRDQASQISGIHNYTKELDSADKYYELKVYQGKPPGFMIANGTFVQDTVAKNAYSEMIRFFRRIAGIINFLKKSRAWSKKNLRGNNNIFKLDDDVMVINPGRECAGHHRVFGRMTSGFYRSEVDFCPAELLLIIIQVC
jgi:dienelactone hydrolase